MKSDHHAVLVGIGKYPGFTDLEGPRHDAEAFRDWLVDPAKGDVDPANVRLLTTAHFHPPDPADTKDTHPWDQDIRNLFYPHVKAALQKAWIGERLYIYMAGHGFTEPQADRNRLTGLYAANADIVEAASVVGTMYAEWFRMRAAFREIVLVMDCCRTNDQLHRLNTSGLPGGGVRVAESRKVKTFYAYATQPGLAARERKLNGGEVRGIFTATFLEALDKAPADDQGKVTGQIVKGYVHQNLRTLAAGVEVDDPEFDSDWRKDIVFLTRAATPRTRVRIRIDPFHGPVDVVIWQGPGTEVGRVTATAADAEAKLRPGFYKATLDGTDRGNLFEVGGSDVTVTL